MHTFLCPVLQKVHFALQVRHLRDGFNAMCDFPFDRQGGERSWMILKHSIAIVLNLRISRDGKLALCNSSSYELF